MRMYKLEGRLEMFALLVFYVILLSQSLLHRCHIKHLFIASYSSSNPSSSALHPIFCSNPMSFFPSSVVSFDGTFR